MSINTSCLSYTETPTQIYCRTHCCSETMRKQCSRNLFRINRQQISKWIWSSQKNLTTNNSKHEPQQMSKWSLSKMTSVILRLFKKITRFLSSTTVTLRRSPCSWCMMLESWEIFLRWKMSSRKKQTILCMLDVCCWPKECWLTKTVLILLWIESTFFVLKISMSLWTRALVKNCYRISSLTERFMRPFITRWFRSLLMRFEL